MPRPPDLMAMIQARENGQPYDAKAFRDRVREAVAEVVRQQVNAGVDIVSDGELGKPSFVTYVKNRIRGFEGEKREPWVFADRAEFPEWDAQSVRSSLVAGVRPMYTGPLGWKDKAAVETDTDNFKAALEAVQPVEAFLPYVPRRDGLRFWNGGWHAQSPSHGHVGQVQNHGRGRHGNASAMRREAINIFLREGMSMKITRVWVLAMSDPVPLESRHRTDLGTKVKTDSAIIFVETDNGLTGMGAALGTPAVLQAMVEHELAPQVVGEDPLFSERIYEKLYNGSRAQPALDAGWQQPDPSRRRGMIMEAVAGIDIAVWDVKAQVLGIPVYKALGAARDHVRGYASGGWAPGDEAEAEMAGYAAKGFGAVKMRVAGRDGFSIDKTVRRVKAARRGIGPNVELMVDAHGSLDVSTAIRLAKALEPYDIAWFEEPVSPDDHPGQALVRQATTIPIASGEREFTRYDFLDLMQHEALDIAQPDVARAGGFTEIRRIAALTSARQIRLAPHAWGSGVLFAASIHVAMAAPNCHILEVSQGYMPMIWDLFEEPFDIRPDGTVHAPERPGLGFTLRQDALERFKYLPGAEYEW